MDPLAELFAHTAGGRRLRTTAHTPWGTVALRDVRRADAEAVHGLLLQVLAEGRGFVSLPSEVGTDPAPSARAIHAIQEGDGVGVVAVLEGTVVGYAFARANGVHRLRHDAHLEIVLAPKVRGGGLGGRLLDALIDRARMADGVQRLSLSVFDDNNAAVRLYRSRGFEDEGLRRGAVLHDDGTLRDDRLMVLWVGKPDTSAP